MTFKCPKFTTPDEKVKQLQSKNYCTRCTARNHETKNCRSNVICKLCDGHHLAFLCKTRKNCNTNRTTNLVTVKKKQGMLLTKEVTIVNPETQETTETVVIFDSGSEESYVSDKIIQQLNLEKIEEEELNVTGF